MTYPQVVVVIPALNEEASLPLVLRDLPPVKAVVVADNGSTDDTAEVARAGGALVVSEPRRGYGAACQAGIARAAKLAPEILVIMDADHSDFGQDLPLLVEPILRGHADFVIGDRTRFASRGSLFPVQRFGNAVATNLIARVTQHRFRDMGPFRALRWSHLSALGMSDPTWGWNVEMQMKAVYEGARILEVPVRYRRRVGYSKISGTITGSVRAGSRILWAVWRYRQR